MRVITLFIP